MIPQLNYEDRIVNPDYLIIIGNKANETMNFSTLRPIIPEVRQRYKPQPRYTIKVADILGQEGMKVITVQDSFSNGKEVFRGTCKEGYLEDNMDVVTKQYRGSSIEDVI